MPFKIVIAEKNGKSWKLELESDAFVGKTLKSQVNGKDLGENLEGYEFSISGASDTAGFPHKAELEGPQLRKILVGKGWGMHDSRKGVRLKKSYRGKQLSEKTSQINLVVIKHGHKKLEEIFPDQNKPQAKAEAPAA